jgi:hypothetical protein
MFFSIYAIIIIILSIAILIANEKMGGGIGFLIPIIMIGGFIIMLMFTIAMHPPGEYDDGQYGYYGDTILYPGKEYLKWPWDKIDIYKPKYDHIIVYIPCVTNDGMRLKYELTYLFVKFHPIAYRDLYNHNMSEFKQVAASRIKPTLDRIMLKISERDFETGRGVDFDEIDEKLYEVAPVNGMKFDPESENYVGRFTGNFMHVDNPKGDY